MEQTGEIASVDDLVYEGIEADDRTIEPSDLEEVIETKLEKDKPRFSNKKAEKSSELYENDDSSSKYKKLSKYRYRGIGKLDGARAVIYYENPETKEREYYLEEKSYDPRNIGKVGLIGGIIDPEDKSPAQALAREIREEIADKKAQDILIEALRSNPNPKYELRRHFGEYSTLNWVYELRVETKEEWGIVKVAGMTADAGNPVVLTQRELPKRDWAYNDFEIISRFISESPVKKSDYTLKEYTLKGTVYVNESLVPQSYLLRIDNKFTPQIYADSYMVII